ncbi:hypothetical protein [Actinomadura latina]|uniref:Zinc-finger domain-containing protein n=1 Tax=Actinomadura latina TaxID=163603 RepID=A0A846YZ58_9ACTN|nr:hypothetical protein [Actinomadura latina]NKZ04977.1 hypothetical protein [Actinomadura latina]
MRDHEPLTPEAIDRLTTNTEPWLSCDDCFERVDAAIDAILGSDAPLPEDFRVHLLACAVCREEADALAALAADGTGLSAAQAVARLEAAVLEADARQ